jgi:hypothetical protein
MTPGWVSLVLLMGWFVLAGSALRARQLSARKTVTYALVWGAILFAVAAAFTAMGQHARP